jgi:hypothetical protein
MTGGQPGLNIGLALCFSGGVDLPSIKLVASERGRVTI